MHILLRVLATVWGFFFFRNESDMVEYKQNLNTTVMSSLQSDMVACRNRTALSKETHSSLLSQRQAVMQDLKVGGGGAKMLLLVCIIP